MIQFLLERRNRKFYLVETTNETKHTVFDEFEVFWSFLTNKSKPGVQGMSFCKNFCDDTFICFEVFEMEMSI